MLRMMWMGLLLWSPAGFAAPAPAKVQFKELPPATEIVGMSPGNYYRVLIGQEYGKVESLVARVRKHAADGDPGEAAQSYDNLNGRLGEARQRLVGFPAYKDEDGALRDAVIEAYTTWGALAVRERDEAAPLFAKTPMSDADVKAWERVRTDLDKGWRDSNKKVREVVDGFADKHRLVFVDEDEGKVTKAPFEAEGMPIGASKLEHALWVASAIRYHNALYAQAGAMVAGMNKATDKMNTTELEPARQEALTEVKAALKEAKKFGAFGGDQGLRDAIVGYGEWMVTMLEGPIKTHAELTKEGKVTRSEADQLDVIANDVAQGGSEHAATLQKELARFKTTWHFDAYLAWKER